MHSVGHRGSLSSVRRLRRYLVNHNPIRSGPSNNYLLRYARRLIEPVQQPRQSGFYPYFASQATDWAEYNGYWMANSMTAHGPIFEYAACRSKTVICDLSSLRKIDVSGPDAVALLQQCLTRDIGKLAVGQIAYSALCRQDGGMIDDGTLYRLDGGVFRWICAIDASFEWLELQAERLGLDVQVEDVTARQSNIAIQGRGARDIMAEVFSPLAGWPAIEDLRWFRFTLARVGADGPVCLVSRTGYTGELGFEVFCDPADAMTVQQAIGAAGEPHGLTPIGMKAMDVLRIEAGLPFLGHEFNDTTDPFEGGLGFTVDLDKPFIGRDALARRKAQPRRKLVGLLVQAMVAPDPGDAVWLDDVRVGTITSATCSLTLKKTVAMARIDAAHAETQGALTVGKPDSPRRRAATLTSLPFFDPGKARIRGDYSA